MMLAIPDDPFGAVRETLKLGRNAVEDGRISPRIRQQALSIVKSVHAKAWLLEMRAVFEWVRDNIRYVRDPRGIEMLHTPEGVLDDGQGDCDDQAILVAALLESIGHPTRFKAVGFRPCEFSHVYAQGLCGTTWVSLDTTEDEPIGWQPPGIVEVMTINIPAGDRTARRRWYLNQVIPGRHFAT